MGNTPLSLVMASVRFIHEHIRILRRRLSTREDYSSVNTHHTSLPIFIRFPHETVLLRDSRLAQSFWKQRHRVVPLSPRAWHSNMGEKFLRSPDKFSTRISQGHMNSSQKDVRSSFRMPRIFSANSASCFRREQHNLCTKHRHPMTTHCSASFILSRNPERI